MLKQLRISTTPYNKILLLNRLELQTKILHSESTVLQSDLILGKCHASIEYALVTEHSLLALSHPMIRISPKDNAHNQPRLRHTITQVHVCVCVCTCIHTHTHIKHTYTYTDLYAYLPTHTGLSFRMSIKRETCLSSHRGLEHKQYGLAKEPAQSTE